MLCCVFVCAYILWWLLLMNANKFNLLHHIVRISSPLQTIFWGHHHHHHHNHNQKVVVSLLIKIVRLTIQSKQENLAPCDLTLNNCESSPNHFTGGGTLDATISITVSHHCNNLPPTNRDFSFSGMGRRIGKSGAETCRPMRVRPRLPGLPKSQEVQRWAKPPHLQTKHRQRGYQLDQRHHGLVQRGRSFR